MLTSNSLPNGHKSTDDITKITISQKLINNLDLRPFHGHDMISIHTLILFDKSICEPPKFIFKL